MHELPNDAVPWGRATAAPSPDEDVPELAGWAADAVVGSAPSKKFETVSARSAAVLATGLLRYGPHTALVVCLIAVAWMVGSYFVGPARTVVQQESVQSVEMGQAAQKMAEEPHTQNPDVEAMRAAESLSAKDAIGLGNTKPGLDAAKTEISAAIAEPSGKVEHLRPKSAEKPSKATERVDRIGLKIAALLAAALVADARHPQRR